MANMFVKIDGIKGSSQDKNHKDWIEVQSMNGAMTLPFTGGRSGTGHAASGTASLSDVGFNKQFDASSVKLMEFCLNATSIKTIEIHVCRRVNKELKTYWEAKIENGVVSSVSQGFNEDMEPTETFSLNGAKWTWQYNVMDKEGKVSDKPKTTWDSVAQAE
ncbi:MAG: Hcp family type VI secretion system effector [Phycisphaerales bacterium]